MGNKTPEAREFFTWNHKVSEAINYSCTACKYNVNGKCDRRPEMAGKTLPVEAGKKTCLFGSAK